MAEIKPFQGVRYKTTNPEEISTLICPPYDIISPSEQSIYYEKNTCNAIRIEYGKEFPEDNDIDNKYTRASGYVNDWIERDILARDENPSIYVYQQIFKTYSEKILTRTGFIALTKLEDLSSGVVLAHENTLSKPKSDRMNLMQTCNANISPIYVLYEDREQCLSNVLLNHVSNTGANIDSEGINGIRERLWVVSDKTILDLVVQSMADKKLFIADGHHRYETALNFRQKSKEKNINHTGEEPYNFTMMLMVDIEDPGLIILPTHRAVNGLEGFSIETLINKAKEEFDIVIHKFNTNSLETRAEEIDNLLQYNSSGTFVLYVANASYCYIIKIKDYSIMEKVYPDRDSSFQKLDVCILHKLILENLLGIGEAQLASQQFLNYTHDVSEGMEWADSGKCQLVFFMAPTSVKQVRDVSLAGEKMPQKSTYFYPKPPTGLVINKF